MINNVSWEEIIPAVIQKDQAATTFLIEQIYNMVFYTCSRMVRDKVDAEDLAQEAMIKIITQLPTMRNYKAFPKWASLITCHTCQDYLRKTKRNIVDLAADQGEDETADPYYDYADPSIQSSPEQHLDTKETRAMMEELIRSLPGVQQEVITMYYYNNMSIAEIAHLTNADEGTVKSRLYYARRSIKNGVEMYQRRDGIKLYSVTPASFLLYIHYFMDQSAIETGAKERLKHPAAGIAAKALEKGTTVMKGSAAVAAAKAASTGAAKKAVSALAIKMALGVMGVSIAAGGTVYGVNAVIEQNRFNDTVDTAVKETPMADAVTEDAMSDIVVEQSTSPDKENIPENSITTEAESISEKVIKTEKEGICEKSIVHEHDVITNPTTDLNTEYAEFEPFFYEYTSRFEQQISEYLSGQGEHDETCLIGAGDVSKLESYMIDLNDDGLPEMIYMESPDSTSGYSRNIYAMYTLIGDIRLHQVILCDALRYGYYLGKDGSICYYGSSGASQNIHVRYRLDPKTAKLVILDGIEEDGGNYYAYGPGSDSDDPLFYPDKSKRVPITQEEYEAIYTQFSERTHVTEIEK